MRHRSPPARPTTKTTPKPAPTSVMLHETFTGARSEAVGTGGSQQLVMLIDAGWGSSGYYSSDVLAEAARQRVFPKGLHLYLDHPTETEDIERPERSVRDLAAVLTEDARYDPQRRALVANTRVFASYREFLSEVHDVIGLSIRANGISEYGEAEGRQGPIIKALTSAASVDYVTHAGRGGRVLALLESARTALRESRNLGGWLESRQHLAFTRDADEMYGEGLISRDERLVLSSAVGDGLTAFSSRVQTDAPQLYARDIYDGPGTDGPMTEGDRLAEAAVEDTRRALDVAVRELYGTAEGYVWVRDFDPDAGTVWYEQSDGEGCETWQQSYTQTTDDQGRTTVALVGDRVEVIAQTVYTPVAPELSTDPPATDPTVEGAQVAESTSTTPSTTPCVAASPPPISLEVPMSNPTGATPAPGTAAGTTQAPAPLASTDLTTDQARVIVAESRLAEANARVAAAEQAVETANRERALREAAEAEVRQMRAAESARGACTTALAASDLPAFAHARVLATVTSGVPLTEAGVVDQPALTTAITAAVEAERAYGAQWLAASGAGTPSGLGSAGNSPTFAESGSVEDWEKDLAAGFGRLGMDSKKAATAAQGR